MSSRAGGATFEQHGGRFRASRPDSFTEVRLHRQRVHAGESPCQAGREAGQRMGELRFGRHDRDRRSAPIASTISDCDLLGGEVATLIHAGDLIAQAVLVGVAAAHVAGRHG